MGIKLGYTNYLEVEAYTVTPSGASVTDDSRLADGRPAEVYRFSHSASADPVLTISATGLSARVVGLFALINTDLPEGTVVSISAAGGATTGSATVETGPDGRRHAVVEVEPATTNEFTITVDDPSGAVAAGDYNIGQAWASASYVPPRGWAREFEAAYVDPSEPGRAVRGDVFNFPAIPYREAQLEALPLQTEAERAAWRRIRHACTGGRRVLVSASKQTPLFGYVVGHPPMAQSEDGERAGLSIREAV